MTQRTDPTPRTTWPPLLVAVVLAVGFLAWGLLLFVTIGSKTPPAWDFGALPEVPGLSVYSTDSQRPLAKVPPFYLHEQAELARQHVRGRPARQETTSKEAMP